MFCTGEEAQTQFQLAPPNVKSTVVVPSLEENEPKQQSLSSSQRSSAPSLAETEVAKFPPSVVTTFAVVSNQINLEEMEPLDRPSTGACLLSVQMPPVEEHGVHLNSLVSDSKLDAHLGKIDNASTCAVLPKRLLDMEEEEPQETQCTDAPAVAPLACQAGESYGELEPEHAVLHSAEYREVNLNSKWAESEPPSGFGSIKTSLTEGKQDVPAASYSYTGLKKAQLNPEILKDVSSDIDDLIKAHTAMYHVEPAAAAANTSSRGLLKHSLQASLCSENPYAFEW